MSSFGRCTNASIRSLEVENRFETDKVASLEVGEPRHQVEDHLEGAQNASIRSLEVENRSETDKGVSL